MLNAMTTTLEIIHMTRTPEKTSAFRIKRWLRAVFLASKLNAKTTSPCDKNERRIAPKMVFPIAFRRRSS